MSFVRQQDTRRGFIVEHTILGEPKGNNTLYIVTDVHGPLLKSFVEPDRSGGHCRGSQAQRVHWFNNSLDGLADLLELKRDGMGMLLKSVPVRSLKIRLALMPLSLHGNTQFSPDDYPFMLGSTGYGQQPKIDAIPAEWRKAIDFAGLWID